NGYDNHPRPSALESGANHAVITREEQGRDRVPPPVSQPATHKLSDVHMPEEQVTTVPSESENSPSALPDWDTVSYVDEYEQLDETPAIQPKSPVNPALPRIPTNPVAAVSPELPSLPDHDNADSPDAVMQPKDEEITADLSLTLQKVKEKWEYIKRR